jgi:hypothetical protein
MPVDRFERMSLAELLMAGCAVIFGACVLIEHAQAQPVNPPISLPPPTFNPSSPYTVPQPRYAPISPTAPSAGPGYVVTSPVNERLPRQAAYSHRRTSVAKTRSVHYHRSIAAGYALEAYPVACGYLGCVRTYPWAFPCQYYSSYCFPYGLYGWHRN